MHLYTEKMHQIELDEVFEINLQPIRFNNWSNMWDVEETPDQLRIYNQLENTAQVVKI